MCIGGFVGTTLKQNNRFSVRRPHQREEKVCCYNSTIQRKWCQVNYDWIYWQQRLNPHKMYTGWPDSIRKVLLSLLKQQTCFNQSWVLHHDNFPAHSSRTIRQCNWHSLLTYTNLPSSTFFVHKYKNEAKVWRVRGDPKRITRCDEAGEKWLQAMLSNIIVVFQCGSILFRR